MPPVAAPPAFRLISTGFMHLPAARIFCSVLKALRRKAHVAGPAKLAPYRPAVSVRVAPHLGTAPASAAS